MFGIAKPCRHNLSPTLYQEWIGHQCGLCLTLREHHGQLSRATTNTDAIVLSILVAAQRAHGVATVTAGPCPLRGMLPATVVAPGDTAAVHAAAVSLTMAATKVTDHARDRDGLAGRVPLVAAGVGRRWASQGDDLAALVGFDTQVVRAAVERSDALERDLGRTFDEYVAPTEDAAAAACRHTAVLAGRPANLDALDELGRMFGRITYLFDAIDDEADDIAHGHFNALVTCYPVETDRRAAARTLFEAAHDRLRAAFDRLDLARAELAREVLVEQIGRSGRRRVGTDASGSTCRHGRPHGPGHGPRHGHDHGHDHHRVGAHPTRAGSGPRRDRIRTNVRVLADLTVATVAAAAVGLAIFRPDEAGGEVPFDPSQQPPFDPSQIPPGQVPPGHQVPGSDAISSGFEDALDVATDAACCCACDSCDCCDCCDC